MVFETVAALLAAPQLMKSTILLTDPFLVQRMTDNDKIVTRYMDDKEFESAAFEVLSKAIYDSIPEQES